jgi:hypothetical protein
MAKRGSPSEFQVLRVFSVMAPAMLRRGRRLPPSSGELERISAKYTE